MRTSQFLKFVDSPKIQKFKYLENESIIFSLIKIFSFVKYSESIDVRGKDSLFKCDFFKIFIRLLSKLYWKKIPLDCILYVEYVFGIYVTADNSLRNKFVVFK